MAERTFEILKRKGTEMEMCTHGGSLGGGRLVGYEVREQKGDYLVYKHTCNKHNWMFQRLGHKIARDFSYRLSSFFQYSQLGTGDTPNSEAINFIVGQVSGLDATNTIYLPTDTHYNFEEFNILEPAVYGSDSVDGDYRITYQLSHKHPVLPTTSAPVTIKEVVYYDNTTVIGNGQYPSQRINSRVVLSEQDWITLYPGQYVVTMYQFQYRLPSFREVAFSDADIQIAGLVPSSGNKAGRVRSSPTLPDDGTVTTTITPTGGVINTYWMLAPVMLISSGFMTVRPGALWDGGSTIYTHSVYPSIGISRDVSFSAFGAAKTNWGSAPYNNSSVRDGNSDLVIGASMGSNGASNTANGSYVINPGDYQYDHRRTVKISRTNMPQNDYEDMLDARSIFIFRHQFLFDNSWVLYSDQYLEISATINIDLLNVL